MPRILELKLSETARKELEAVRDRHPQPHMREKAAAILKIAAGSSGSEVARSGLLRRRDNDTIYRWVARYRANGIAGLAVRRGRGRKAAFSPSARDDS
ncbi:MAG: helix-turn-helix domain-containing protein [Chloroflexi bacterium]|nr:MAG: helix-turn-helix domain-containing protein [Chloroflexota bacterium]